jgi:hypothetical protein
VSTKTRGDLLYVFRDDAVSRYCISKSTLHRWVRDGRLKRFRRPLGPSCLCRGGRAGKAHQTPACKRQLTRYAETTGKEVSQLGQPNVANPEVGQALFWGILILGFAILIESLSHPKREAQITVRGHDVEVRPVPMERSA